MTAPRSIVTFQHTVYPVPANERWWAYYKGDTPNDAGDMPNGCGCTEDEAVANLLAKHPGERAA